MIAVSYNINPDGGSCIIISRGFNILDIIISKLDVYNDKYNRVYNISKSVADYVEKFSRSRENVLISYPPILKKNKQSDILRDILPKKDIKFNNQPLKICNSINRMISQDRLKKVSFDSEQIPIKVYTDASIIDDGISTIGFSMVDNNNELIMLEAREVKGYDQISNCELTAGVAGISKAKQYGYDNIIWISDNKDAQNILESNNNFGSVLQRESIRSLRDNFTSFVYEDIRGKNNDLADGLADDVRKKRFPRYLSYKSPQLESRKS